MTRDPLRLVSVFAYSRFHQLSQLLLANHVNTQCPRFLQFTASVGARNDVRRLLRHAAGHLATVGLDELRRLVARKRVERPGEHERLAAQGAGGLGARFLEIESALSEPIDQAPRL